MIAIPFYLFIYKCIYILCIQSNILLSYPCILESCIRGHSISYTHNYWMKISGVVIGKPPPPSADYIICERPLTVSCLYQLNIALLHEHSKVIDRIHGQDSDYKRSEKIYHTIPKSSWWERCPMWRPGRHSCCSWCTRTL